ncbi:hypothetical protein EKG37_17900 [Robertmurraya yapensis]|uniref:Uncharacterized protein n=1 Tax=Bacillus yapensis TaxID=2492960 RepID=A0A3S0JSQ2_9BACI|nr:hypothetical protein [Bacillus yapensis]RTR28174.1 hypothetical protein EKG37_17900 [Bacillus yapensis]TKS94418.1 hypothetical protein FAR12_17910 [Bacillus yapensis]
MNIFNGILAATIAFTGGAGLSLFSDKDTPNQDTVSQEERTGYNQMVEMMETGDFESMQKFMDEGNGNFDKMQKYMEEGNINFGQMKPYMSEMHPNLDNQQLEEMYKGMHGTGGFSQSSNFKGMGSL